MKLIYFLLVASLFSVTLGEFGHFPFGGSSNSVSLTDVLLTLSLIFLLIWKVGIKRNLYLPRTYKLLLIFPLVGLISLAFNTDFRGITYLIRLFIYSSGFLPGYFLISEKIVSKDRVIFIMITTGFLLSVIGIGQLIFYPDLESLTGFGFDPHKNRLVSAFLDPNFMGAYLSLTLGLIIFMFTKYQNKIWLILGGLLAIAIFLTFSRSAYLMVATEVFVYLSFKAKKLLILLAIVTLLAYFFIPQFALRINGIFHPDKSANERLESWQKGIFIFEQKPILGVGFNNLRFNFEQNNLLKVFSENGGHSGAGVDSAVIFILATTGILGLVAYFSWWGYFFIKNLHQKDELIFIFGCMMAGLFLDSQFINSLFYPPIMLSIYLLAGVIEGIKK